MRDLQIFLCAVYFFSAIVPCANYAIAKEDVDNVRRDPFRSFLLDMKTESEGATALERYELGSLKLVGIVMDEEHPSAMIEDDSKMGYVAKLGTPIGKARGIVVDIAPDHITIEEFSLDFYGDTQTVKKVLRLPAQ